MLPARRSPPAILKKTRCSNLPILLGNISIDLREDFLILPKDSYTTDYAPTFVPVGKNLKQEQQEVPAFLGLSHQPNEGCSPVTLLTPRLRLSSRLISEEIVL